jgi:hypothetical protein
MKTPTNFIPIIGPLYADDLHIWFIIQLTELPLLIEAYN